MTTDSIGNSAIASTQPTPSAATAAGTQYSEDYETFLTLLTTQLTNQDPTAPMETDKFTEQLVLYSEVEQAIETNANLEKMLDTMQADRLTSSIGYVGQWVELSGSSAILGDTGGASIGYTMVEGAQSATVNVRDATGELVVQLPTTSVEGDNTFTWDGRDVNGTRQPAGAYQIEVEAFDQDGNPLAVNSNLGGVVDSIELVGDSVALIVNGTAYGLDSVRSVTNLSTHSASPQINEEEQP